MNRLYIVIITFIYFLAPPVNAQWFDFIPEVEIQTHQSIVKMTNPWSFPIYCEGYAVGLTYYGDEPKEVIGKWVFPDFIERIYMRSSYGDPFVDVWVKMQCRFQSSTDCFTESL